MQSLSLIPTLFQRNSWVFVSTVMWLHVNFADLPLRWTDKPVSGWKGDISCVFISTFNDVKMIQWSPATDQCDYKLPFLLSIEGIHHHYHCGSGHPTTAEAQSVLYRSTSELQMARPSEFFTVDRNLNPANLQTVFPKFSAATSGENIRHLANTSIHNSFKAAPHTHPCYLLHLCGAEQCLKINCSTS